MEFFNIYVWPDNFQTDDEGLEEALRWKSDDFIVRKTCVCDTCHHVVELDYDEPFGYCECGVSEWHL